MLVHTVICRKKLVLHKLRYIGYFDVTLNVIYKTFGVISIVQKMISAKKMICKYVIASFTIGFSFGY